MHSLFNPIRKVLALGSASYAIILPKEWVLHQHIGKGSEVLLFPQQNGQIIVEKSRNTKTKVILDASILGVELLDGAIQSSFILNVDDTVIKFFEEDNLCDKIDRLWEVSKQYPGMELSISGPHEVTMTCLVNTVNLNINGIFNQLLSICRLLLAQIEKNYSNKDNHEAIAQMEENYHLGVRLLTFAIRNQYLGLKAGMKDIIQVLGYRVALLAMRSIIVQLHNIFPYLKTTEIPNLTIILELFYKLTQQAVKCLSETEIYSIKQLTEFWDELRTYVDKIEDAAGNVRNFFNNYLDIILTFKELAVTRHVENLEIFCEE